MYFHAADVVWDKRVLEKKSEGWDVLKPDSLQSEGEA